MPIKTSNNDTYDRAAFINCSRREEGIFSSDVEPSTAEQGLQNTHVQHDFDESADGDTRAHQHCSGCVVLR